jgi:hypothetical protein
LAQVIHENVKFSSRRQKNSYNNILINVAAQHFLDRPVVHYDGGHFIGFCVNICRLS